MTGTITASLTGDWLLPYEVRLVHDETGPETATRHRSGRDAQIEMLRLRALHPDHTLVYNVCAEGSHEPRTISTEEWLARIKKICGKCRKHVPLKDFEPIYRRDTKGQQIHHGWHDDCRRCEEASS